MIPSSFGKQSRIQSKLQKANWRALANTGPACNTQNTKCVTLDWKGNVLKWTQNKFIKLLHAWRLVLNCMYESKSTFHHFAIINLQTPGQARQKPTIINTILCLRPRRCQLGPSHYEFCFNCLILRISGDSKTHVMPALPPCFHPHPFP